MLLFIDTTQKNSIEILLKDKNRFIFKKKFSSFRAQSEKLLLMIEKTFEENKLKLKNIKKIQVVNFGGSFTCLRTGVVIANALGYSLNIPVVGVKGKTKIINNKNGYKFNIVKPIYNCEPNIINKNKTCGLNVEKFVF